MVSALRRISQMVLARLDCMVFMANSTLLSSPERVSTLPLKSPTVILSASGLKLMKSSGRSALLQFRRHRR